MPVLFIDFLVKMNTNQKPFAYCQIMPAMMLIVCVLCYQISSGRYMAKEQEDILENNDSNVV